MPLKYLIGIRHQGGCRVKEIVLGEQRRKNSILPGGNQERLPGGGDKQYILDFSAIPKPTDHKHYLLILDLRVFEF